MQSTWHKLRLATLEGERCEPEAAHLMPHMNVPDRMQAGQVLRVKKRLAVNRKRSVYREQRIGSPRTHTSHEQSNTILARFFHCHHPFLEVGC